MSYKLQLLSLLDPIIRIGILVGGIVAVILLLRTIMPKVSIDYNPFNPLITDEVVEDAKTGQRNKILNAIVRTQRAIKRSNRSLDDRQILQNFFLWSISFFLVAYLILGIWTGIFSRHFNVLHIFNFPLIGISLAFACMPLGWMGVRLHRVRIQNSYDLVPAVSTLLSKYRYFKGNLYFAINDMCKKDLKGDIRSAFMIFLPALQGTGETTIEEAVEDFFFRIPYDRAIELGICIMKRIKHGDDIDMSLAYMVADMSEQRKINRKIKTDNRETVQLAYLPVFLIPFCILGNAKLNGWHKVIYYYFVNPTGVKFLILTIVVCIGCAITAFIIQKPRNGV